jgi:aflatoxin B1 aldehyde reductase
MYNAIQRNMEVELIPACKRYGLDVVVYNPVAGGVLSGKYKTADVPESGRYSDSVGAMGQQYRGRYFKDTTFEALRIIEPVIAKHGLTMIETALRWVIHHSKLNVMDGTDGIILGVSSFDQLEGNLKECEKGPLPEEVVKALDEAWMVTKAEASVYWHQKLEYTYDTKKALFG